MGKVRERHKRLNGFQWLFLVLVFSLMATLGTIFSIIPENSPGLAAAVASLQGESGVESPITAVLLNFRGYDTMLEVVVLLLAVIGVWSLVGAPFPEQKSVIRPVQIGVVRLLAPVMCLVAAYLVWQGSHMAGGAFQGGAILGAAGVLLLVSELRWQRAVPVSVLRIGLVLGSLFFIGIALYCFFYSGDLLAYPKRMAGGLILLIETTCAISIGLTLALLFAGGRPEEDVSDGDIP